MSHSKVSTKVHIFTCRLIVLKLLQQVEEMKLKNAKQNCFFRSTPKYVTFCVLECVTAQLTQIYRARREES
jgi:hypothetical protein